MKEIKTYLYIAISVFALFCLVEFALCFKIAPSFSRMVYVALIVATLSLVFKSKARFLGTFALLFVSSGIYAFIFGFFSKNAMTLKVSLALNILVIALCFVFLIFVKQKRFFAFIIALILSIPSIIYLIYFSYTFSYFDTEALLAVLQTTKGEALGYIQEQHNFWQYFIIIAFFTAAFIFAKNIALLELKERNKGFYLCIFAVLIFCAMLGKKVYEGNIFHSFYTNINLFLKDLKEFRQNENVRINSAQNISIKEQNATFVIVIGESANKNNMSLYGYERTTTPRLDALSKDENFIKFTAAYSAHTHTTQTLTYALSAKNQYNDLELSKAITIIELAKLAGFKTAWISNQAKYGMWGSPLANIASSADYSVFLNENDHDNKLDELLLPELEKYKNLAKSPKNLIIIHTIGSHVRYADRYPNAFATFGLQSVDKYDNSVLYSDFIITEILKSAKKFDNFAGMLYFSDHAEDLSGLMHDSNQFRFGMTYIPFIAYFAPEFSAKNTDLISALKAHQNSTWTNDLLFNLLSSLLGIKSSLDEPNNDISSEFYDANKSRFKTLYGKKFLSEDGNFQR